MANINVPAVTENNEDLVKLQDIDKAASEAVASVQNSVKITDKDKAIAAKKQEGLKDDQIVLDLQKDLETFVSDKVDIEAGDGVIERLSTGIDLLDAILGGGFGLGTFTQIIGNPGTFKSALVAQLFGQAQRKYQGKLLTAYYDSENTMTTERLAQLGVNQPKIRPYSFKVTIEKVFKTIEAFCAFKELRKLNYPGIIAWDSIANTSCEKEFTTDDPNQTIGLKARILSALFPRYIPKLKDNKISLIAVNQLREKLDMGQFSAPADLRWMGDKDIPGGQAVKFNSFHLLFLRARGDLKPEMYGFNGLLMEAKCIKNKFFKPNIPIELIVDFNRGISNFWTNYNFLVKQKRMESGAWNYLVSLPNKKFRTKDAPGLYNSDKEFKNEFDKQVKEAIKAHFSTDSLVQETEKC